MLAKIFTKSPTIRQDIEGKLELTFPVEDTSAYAVRQLWARLKNNEKTLQLNIDFEKKQRTLNQNDLLWGLLTEYAKALNGGRKSPEITAESLYLKAINDYGKDTLISVKEGAEGVLKRVYRRVFVIDKFQLNGEAWLKCRCVLGSSNYDTKEMSDLIDGVLDEMSKNGITSEQIMYLRSEYGR